MPAKGFRYDVKTRFLKHVRKSAGCHTWTGMTNRGYGVFWFNDKRDKAHRVAYELFKGEVPEGTCVLHECDNPSCVNPKHLFLGTKGDNNIDRHLKGRSRNQWTGPLNGGQCSVGRR